METKKAGVAVLISDKMAFEIKAMKRDKEGHYIMIKGSIQEEDITIINIYAPNIGAPQYIRQMLTNMKWEINNNTIIVGDFNTSLTPIGRSTKQKINKETQTLNNTIDHLDLFDIYRTFHLKTGDTYRLKVKGWKNIFHANRDQKTAGVAILISDKIDFKTKAVKRDKEGHYIMIKGSIQEEDITIINIYAPKTGAPQYVRQMLTSMKGEININTIIVGDFNTPLTCMDRSTKQKINKETNFK